jgi:hypothetical protein
MAWDGYFEYAGTAIINVSRTEAYAKNAGLSWFKPYYKNTSLAPMLAETYRSPVIDNDAPWLDPSVPESYEFYGAYPVSVTGIEDSSRTSTVTQNVDDGAFATRLRHGNKSPVFNVLLIGETDAACDYGFKWLKQALLTGACDEDGLPPLCYLASEPQVDLDDSQLVWVADDGGTDLDGGAPTDLGGDDLDDGSPYVGDDDDFEPDLDGGDPDDIGGDDLDGGDPDDIGGDDIYGGGPGGSAVDLDGGTPFGGEVLVSVDINPADCLTPLMRSLHKVQFNSGPTVTAKYPMPSGGEAWSVTFSGVADPWEFGSEVGVIAGFLDPDVTDPWVGGIPDGGVIDLDGAIYTETHCTPIPAAPLEDPLCPATIAPPLPPSLSLGCFELPANWRRRQITIPATYIPVWGEVVPKFEVHATDVDVRYLRLRFYADPDGDGDISDDPCAFCGDIVISYIPAGYTLVFDSADRAVYVIDGTQRRRRADSVVSSADGTPFEWPILTCGVSYIVTLDLPQTQAPPVFDLSFFSRAS